MFTLYQKSEKEFGKLAFGNIELIECGILQSHKFDKPLKDN